MANEDKKYITVRETFYTTGEMERKYFDRFLYRGRGRPRNSDYSPLYVIQSKLNTEHNNYLNSQLLK